MKSEGTGRLSEGQALLLAVMLDLAEGLVIDQGASKPITMPRSRSGASRWNAPAMRQSAPSAVIAPWRPRIASSRALSPGDRSYR